MSAEQTRVGWLKDRAHHVGASEVAAVLGVSPWSSPYDVWARKTGRIPADIQDPDAQERLTWGTRLEPVIVEEAGRRLGKEVHRASQDDHVIHPLLPCLSATPDAYIVDNGLLECKTSLGYGAKNVWAGDDVPLHYQLQVQAQLACTGRDYAIVAALVTGPRLDLHRLERHEGAIHLIEDEIPAWWAKYVDGDIPPPVDAHPATVRALEALHRECLGGIVDLPAEAAEWAKRLESIKAERESLDEEDSAIKARIKAAIGAAEAGRLPGGGGWSWRVVERKAYSVEANSSRQLRRVKRL